MLILFLLSLFIPLLLGVPVAFSLIISAIVLMSTKDLFTTQLVVQQFIGGINSFSLLAVPFFMLAGELMNKGGITRRIVDVVGEADAAAFVRMVEKLEQAGLEI